MGIFHDPLIIPLGAFVMVIFVVGIFYWYKAREKELQAHQELRLREMEHDRKLKEMEIEKARIELDKARVSKGS